MNTKAISIIYILILLSLTSVVNAKDFYWIGGSGNWNEIQHWSDQPGGQVNPDATVPNFDDNVFFDEHSFPTAGAEVIINDVAKCANMDWSKVTNMPTFKSDTNPAHFLTVYGSFKLSTNMLLDILKPLYFSASSLNNEIDFAGHTYNEDIHFTKNGGWLIKTPLHVQNHIIYFEQGHLSFEADVTCGQIVADNAISRTWNLNDSEITLTGAGASILLINADNLNLNSGNSKIISNAVGASIDISGSSPISFYDVEFQKNGASILNNNLSVNFNHVTFLEGGILKGVNQFQDLTFTRGKDYKIHNGADQTIQNKWTAIGTCSEHINVSGVNGTGSIVANSVTLEYLKIQDIAASGAAAPFNADDSFDLGGNTGWNIVPLTPDNYSWTGFVDNKWSTPGNWNKNCVPSRIDNATISGTYNIEIDSDAECKNLILSDDVTLSGDAKLSIFGSLNAGSATWNLLGTTHFEGDAAHSITINNPFKGDVYFSGLGTWQLATGLQIPNNTLYLESGTITSNDNDLRLNRFVSTGDLSRTLNLGTSNLRLNGNFLKTWDIEGRSFNINGGYLIELVAQNAGFYNNHSTTINYNKVHFIDPREKANLNNEGAIVDFKELHFLAGANIAGNHSFDTFILSAGKTYLFESGSEQTITQANGFIAEGSCSEYIYLTGKGGISNIKSDVNSNRIAYVQITDIKITGGIPLSGGLNAVSSFGISNYTGWNIIPKAFSEDFTWKGTEDSDWFNPKNWDPECVPTRLDNVFINETNLAPGGSKTVTVNGTRIPECNNMTWSNATNLKFEGSSDLHIYGNLDFSTLPSPSFTFNGPIFFKNEAATVNIKLDQVLLTNDVTFEGNNDKGGTWNIDSKFETSGNIEMEKGILNSNNFDITCNKFYSNFSDIRTLQLGSSTIKLKGIFLTPENLTFNAGTSEIIVDESGKVEVTNGNEAVNFHHITFDKETGTALFSIRGKSVSFNQIDLKSNANFLFEGFDVENLILNQGKTYKFSEGQTFNIGDLTAIGACEGTIDISSLSAGSETTFASKNGSPISVTQVNLLDVYAEPAATFTANNSIDLGNNDGWTFATAPTTRNLFWVGGTGTWDDPNHWSTTSGGVAGACVPTALDNVHFDVNSFSDKNQIVSTGSGDIRCRTMDWRGSEGTFPIFKTGLVDISSVYIYGSLYLNPSLSVYIPNVDFYFRSTEKGNTLNLFDFEFPKDVTFDGIDGEWTLASNLSIDESLILDNGHFIASGYNISCNYFESSDLTLTGKTRTLDIQNSTFTILGYEGSFSVNIHTADINARQTLSLLADGSEIIVESEKAFFIGGGFSSNATFNIIRFNNKGSLKSENLLTKINDLTFEEGGELNGTTGEVTFDIGKLTLNKGTKPNTFTFQSNIKFPIEEFTALGSCNFPIHIKGSKSGKQADLEVKTSLNANFIELTDINGVGSAVTYTANNSLEHTNVTNWTVNSITAVDLYWVGNGLNNEWSNYLNWSKTSGGTSEGCIPTERDNVFFDSKSFLGSKTVLVNSDAKCHNMTWTDDVDPASIFTVQNQLDIHGFLDFSENMTLEMSGDLKFKGDGLTDAKPIDFAGKTLDGNIFFDGKDQSWFLQSKLSTSGDLFLNEGALDTKGLNLTISSFTSLNTSPIANRSLTISGSFITVNAEKFQSWNMNLLVSPFSFTATNSTLYFPKKGGIFCVSNSDVAFGDAIFDGYGEIDINKDDSFTGKGEFKTVIFRQQGQIFGDHTIFNIEFTLGYGKNTIQAGRTINLTKKLIMEGVNCSYVHLKSSKPGVKAFINAAEAQRIYHASLEDLEMTDGNKHKVVGNYLNVGNSTIGWSKTVEDDDDEEAPSFKEVLPVREEWCSSSATLDHVTYFPINDRTTFQWAFKSPTDTDFSDLPGETSATIVVEETGFYRVELNYNDPSGDCRLYSTIEVEMNKKSNITIEFTSNNVQCYGNSDGFVKAVAKNGNAPYTFFWKDEAGDPVSASSPIGTPESFASGLAPGKYFVQVKDDKGCDETSSVDVFNAYEIFINNITKTDLKCFNITNGEIAIDASGGKGTLTYYLDGNLESNHITGLAADDYIVHVQDGNNCKSDEEDVEITSPDEITFDFASSDILCAGDKNGSIDPQVKGGVKPYLYDWSSDKGFSSNSPTLTNIEGAKYTIKITDENKCVYTEVFELREPEAIILDKLTVSNANCFGESTGEIFVQADKGTAPYEYTIGATTNTSGEFKDLSANTYTLEVTDKNKCTKTQAITIDEPIELGFVTSDEISPTCNNLKDGIINIVPYGGNGDYSFAWSGPNDFRSYAKNNTGLDFGEYTLLLKDKKECSYEGTVDLEKKSPLQLGLIVEEEVSAPGASDGSFRLEILGGTIPYTYTVSGPNGYSRFSPTFFDEDKAVFDKLVGGLYTVTITDESSCGNITKDIMLPEGNLLVSQIINQEDISCTGYNDGALNATAIGGNGTYSYSWSGPSGFAANTKSISALSPGTYTLTVQSAGQTATDQAIILEPTALIASHISNDIACFNEPNGSAELDISGGTKPYSILWEGDRGLYSHADKIYDLAKGDYDYQITDARGCILSNTVTINEPDVVSIKAVPTDISDIGLRDGMITATAVGGTPPYTIFISGPNKYSKKSFNNLTGIYTVDILEQGVYVIEVLDANECRAITETRIYEKEKMVVSLVSKTTPVCYGGNEGSIEVLIEDGSGDFTLSWEADNHYKKTIILTTSNSDKIENLEAGIYTLTVTDNVTNEVITFEQEVKQPDLVTLEYGIDHISCFGLTDGYINIYPKGGTPNYTYAWTGTIPGNATNEDQAALSPGSYSVIVTDSRACVSSEYTFEIKEPALFAGSHTIKEPLCYGDKNGEVKLDITAGATPYTVNWNTGAVTQNISNLRKGTYTYTVVDNEDCKFTNTVDLTQPDTLITEINIFNDVVCYGQNNGEASATVSGGSVPYKFNWSNGETTQDISNLRPKKYELIVTDDNDCQDVASVVIEEPEELLLRVEANRPTVEGANDGKIVSKAFGGIPAYDASWEIETGADLWSLRPETGLEIADLDRGKYRLTLKDQNFCTLDTIINLEYLYDRMIEIPKAFTPNQDGYNDYWDILRIEYIQRLTIVIYDRLGASVYKFSGTGNEYKGNPWKGNNKNSQLPIGSYYYAIEADDSKPLTGTVTIAR